MISDVHYVPGRLRVRCLAVKGDHPKASRLAAQLWRIPGVSQVKASAVTGSVTVLYDPSRLPLAELLARLEQSGVEGAAGLGDTALAGGHDSSDRLIEWAGQAALSYAVERVMENCGLSLLAALI